ncbi:MAG: pyruvate:ferredoxin (flavodoxin) oxidoreductase [Deltaproteobacteria bacterium]|jgi:pyruvate-ferredoxin/flavodoxin oxidoreductase|nr:pyruvate:ferredoxin (flavodoxin) oxidoreductase [Deltaproteobacteria bacterium]MBW2532738.1 pyruvate:ferredoxin (flavodoxin) oxidoreductase [Deltaproteobacteria bacterium]
MSRRILTIDGNEAAANVAHRINEVCAIYPITPSSNMGEWADQWSAEGKTNIWGTVPDVIEMQSEAGAAAAVHGALQTGALTTTFTASQGLLLMIPTMFKVSAELTPAVFHVSARTVATHALSIFGDHSDIMAVRSTGYGLLSSGSVQEVMDFACIAQAISLESRLPFVHFFEGFRVSHEVSKIEELTNEDLAHMISDELVQAHRARAMSPDHPVLRGTSQNPDVFFQARERFQPYYDACPAIVQKVMDKFGERIGRHYKLFDYFGAPDAEKVIVLMGSGAQTGEEVVEHLMDQGEKVGLVKVRLYRPFSSAHLAEALPATVKKIAVLDRTKEPGAGGEPLYKDVVTAISELFAAGKPPCEKFPTIIGGRYGLSSKEFNPPMVKAVFDELDKAEPKNYFTVGIEDDVSHSSLPMDKEFVTERKGVHRGLFYGLGSDGTVGANKNTIKIIGTETDNYAQGYFVYDSKKAGAVTVSHVRFGKDPIKSCYLIQKANFIGCHPQVVLAKFDMLEHALPGATFLLNTQASQDEVWDTLPQEVQKDLIDKQCKLYVIDAYKVAKDAGMGSRVNTIMQTCFFAISGVLEKDEAIQAIKDAIKKTYGAKGDRIVQLNYKAVDMTLENLHEVPVPGEVTSKWKRPPAVPAEAPEYLQKVVKPILLGHGDDIPVSAFPDDATFPTATAMWEKRNIALEIPVWDPDLCTECGKCALVCPHAAVRTKIFDKKIADDAPPTFKTKTTKTKDFPADSVYCVQVAPEDCTGCTLCVEVCPGKDKKDPSRRSLLMAPQPPLRAQERTNYDFFLKIPEADRSLPKITTVKGSQLLQPLFEYSGACSGCGETPYVKLVTQLFGDRAVIANATGCSSIYGGNLPTTPYTVNAEGRGPTWNNSLFEDAAEFAYGFRLTLDKHNEFGRELVQKMSGKLGDELVKGILEADQSTEGGIAEQRERVKALRDKLAGDSSADAKNLLSVADALVKKSVWAFGGDGWAYDIGYGGLDHVLASGRNVNALVVDTEVYSNTGGQASKSTPKGAVAKFAFGGKPIGKKDLGLISQTYGNIYVAQVAMGANDVQCVRAFLEAEAYPGPSIIIAYSHCIAHGIPMEKGLDHQKAAVDSGHIVLYRYNPLLAAEGKNPLKLDSKPPKISMKDFAYSETRFKMLTKSQPENAARFLEESQREAYARWRLYSQLAAMSYADTQGDA